MRKLTLKNLKHPGVLESRVSSSLHSESHVMIIVTSVHELKFSTNYAY